MSPALSPVQLLERLAFQEITTASFPTHFSVIIRLRAAMNDKTAPQRKTTVMLKAEPVISAKIIQTANSAASHGHPEIKDINTAIMTLGLSNIRRIALGVVMTQLEKSQELLSFSNLARSLWLHSLETAVASSVFAEELTNFNADEAFFSGLVVNIGAFYLLYQAAQYPELLRHPDDVHSAIRRYHATSTKKILEHLDLPVEIIKAADMTDYEPVDMLSSPKTMHEVVVAANLFSMDDHPWFEKEAESVELGSMYMDLRNRIEIALALLQSEFHS